MRNINWGPLLQMGLTILRDVLQDQRVGYEKRIAHAFNRMPLTKMAECLTDQELRFLVDSPHVSFDEGSYQTVQILKRQNRKKKKSSFFW